MNKQQLDKFTTIAKSYYHLKLKNEELNRQFDIEKKKFYETMSKFWSKNKIQEKTFKNEDFSVTKSQSIKLVFDIPKLKLKLNKEQISKCIKTTYEVTDTYGLMVFLKNKGIAFSDVKKFFAINQEVDQKVINELSEIGDIKMEDISDCYEVITSNPYFKVNAIESKGDGEI